MRSVRVNSNTLPEYFMEGRRLSISPECTVHRFNHQFSVCYFILGHPVYYTIYISYIFNYMNQGVADHNAENVGGPMWWCAHNTVVCLRCN